METGQKRSGIKSRKRAIKRRRRKHAKKVLAVLSVAVLLLAVSLIAIGVAVNKKVQKTNKEIEAKNLAIEREKAKVEVSLSMVGDVLMHNPTLKSGEKEDGSYNYDHLFQNVKEHMESVDSSLVNQEVILGGTELGISAYPAFNAPQELGDALANSGFNTILHATNHTLDRSVKGVNNTLAFWKEKHPEVTVLGIHSSQEEKDQIYIFEKRGFKIAILNYTYGTNGIKVPEDKPYLLDLMDRGQMEKDIQKAKELADYVIVCPHWGTEYVFEATDEQKEWTDFFLEQGVDLVIGTHPHVIEPVEWVEKDGHKMLVFYSLGNFISCQDKWYRMLGAMANVKLLKDADGKVTVTEYGVEPLVTHIGKKTDYTTYYLKDYTEELAKANRINNLDSSFSLEKIKNLSKEVFGDLYQEGEEQKETEENSEKDEGKKAA